MKRLFKIFSIIIALFSIGVGVIACSDKTSSSSVSSTSSIIEEIDYVSQLKLDMTTNTKKVVATVKSYIDGDTTHFNIPSGNIDGDVLKARYLAIDTPESTGQIQEWGKKASNFTKSRLSNATSIIIESDDDKWNVDSTGSRHLVWVWYKINASDDYRNLNLEILQNGLAIASNTARNRYGTICMAALNQARTLKLNVYSGEKDPDFYYGEAKVLTLKELRANIADYEGMNVAFEAVVTKNYNNALFVEDYDETTGLYYGLYVYLGYSLPGKALEILSLGNRVLFVGSLQYYEVGGTYQLANLKYKVMKPDDPTNIKLISTGNATSFKLTDAETFVNGKVTLEFKNPETEEVTLKEFDYANLALNTSVTMKSLVVKSIYTTTNEDSSSKGAMTLTCKVGDITIKVRTVVLYDGSGNLITKTAFEGKTIDVKGFVDYFDGEYQIKVFSINDVTFIE
jgi:endonuclease YncB( thermonuclease family)